MGPELRGKKVHLAPVPGSSADVLQQKRRMISKHYGLEPEFEVLSIVTDGRTLLQKAEDLKPDLIIVNLAMPQLNGLDACEIIKQKNHRVKVIFLTMTLDAEVAAEAFRRGASGYVPKHCGAEELLIAARRVLRGESYLSPCITRDTVEFLLR